MKRIALLALPAHLHRERNWLLRLLVVRLVAPHAFEVEAHRRGGAWATRV